MNAVVYVLDVAKQPVRKGCKTVLWRGFSNSDHTISIPQLIEDHAEELKARYLFWIYDLGEKSIDGQRLIDHLVIRKDLSYWWMTLISEKCNFAHSTYINDAIRLMAFDLWASTQAISKVILVTSNRPLVECMRQWCFKREINFELQYTEPNPINVTFLNRIYTGLPMFIQGLVKLVQYFVERWPLIGLGSKEWRNSKSTVVFFSYLFNLAPEAVTSNNYESHYWSNLPNELKKDHLKTSWLHIYCKSDLLPSAKHAAELLKKYNQKERGEQIHLTLESFITWPVILKTLRDYIKLIFIGRNLEADISQVSSKGLVLWPLFSKDWSKTFSGANAMENCLYINLFESAMKFLPNQQVGVYLYEQQPWELALINAWNNHGHGRLIAAQHSTMLYWDLRYFHDPRSYKKGGHNELPMPNQVAVNAHAVKTLMIDSGYPENNLIEVEALRYAYLNQFKNKVNIKNLDRKKTKRLLVLCDYMQLNTSRQLGFLAKALPLINEKLTITVKSHPACPVKKTDYPDIIMTVTDEPISYLLSKCDIAYTSASTSAAIDAYCFGVPVVSLSDPNTLNLSPLRGFSGVVFARSPLELATALISYSSQTGTEINEKNYFFDGLQLPRWRKLFRDSIFN